ncbi:hypothetical protein NPIL_398931 [Nephila pilipes]|uniref:Uncharacterized protein n=1 Tax=Nephila pilipes TaxID=299642 RepID=A0A8X6QYH1_NEPPI|nr:hypothetical protein NPIL_398931 [Nephila pilipes]
MLEQCSSVDDNTLENTPGSRISRRGGRCLSKREKKINAEARRGILHEDREKIKTTRKNSRKTLKPEEEVIMRRKLETMGQLISLPKSSEKEKYLQRRGKKKVIQLLMGEVSLSKDGTTLL